MPPELNAFLDAVVAATGGATFGAPEVGRIRAAWRTWATSVGVDPSDIGDFRDEATCRPLLRGFGATYRVGWRWEGGLRAWSIELTWDNRLGEPVWVQFGGSARVRGIEGVRERAYLRAPGGGLLATWGGSSADMGNRPPGRTVETVGVVPEPRTTGDGGVDVLTFYASAGRGDTEFCTLSVSPAD